MSNILVTGNTGYIGSKLVKHISNGTNKIYTSNTKENNLESYKTWNFPKLDYIYHCAAFAKAGDYCLTSQREYWVTNQKINTSIVDYWTKEQPQAKLVAFGTSCSYTPDIPHTEDNYLLGTPYKDLYYYAMTKRMLLIGLQAAEEQDKLNYKYYILPTVYGPKFSESDNHFIYDLVRKAKLLQAGQDQTLWGDGEQTRQLLYIDDLLNVIINDNSSEKVLNVAFNKAYSIKYYSSLVRKELGISKPFMFDPHKYVGVVNRELDYKKLSVLFPYGTPLDEGIKNILA